MAITHQVTDDERRYVEEWARMMVRIWRDRLQALGIHDTGALEASVREVSHLVTPTTTSAAFTFLTYGVYVDAGVGKGYRRGNGGNLYFLDKAYRLEHNKGKARERRPWFSRSWYISCCVMKDFYARALGDDFRGLLTGLLQKPQ